MVKRISILLALLCLLVSCGTGGNTYRIGIDPSWFPIDFQGREANISAFSNELLMAIGHEEGVLFERVTMDWDNLTRGLEEKQYDGILSSLTPRVFLERTYTFSDPFLHIGPVLVVRSQAKVHSIEQMKGKEIAVDSLANEAVLLEHFPGINVQYYMSIPEGIEDVLYGRFDGILVNFVQATSFVRGLYYDKVKIATSPLSDEGLRLLTLNGENKKLVTIFNRGLEKLQRSGKLDKLLKKWELY